MNPKTIFVCNWSDPKVQSFRDDCMAQLSPGVYFHVRLNTVIVVNRELKNPI
jgi:hypothetical protein